MKIVFWNIQRGSSNNVDSEAVEKVIENCTALARCNPEFIILCEAQKGARKTMSYRGGVQGYAFVKPDKFLGNYQADTTLRYVVLARQDVNCVARYVDTTVDRPALHITSGGLAFLVIHAPSVTNTVRPQSNALGRAFLNSSILQPPAVILGDFNVDARVAAFRGSFARKVTSKYGDAFGHLGNLVPKYDRDEYTRRNTSLDWALTTPAWGNRVTVHVLKNRDRNDDIELKGYNKKFDNREYRPKIKSTEKSDHEAILVEIS